MQTQQELARGTRAELKAQSNRRANAACGFAETATAPPLPPHQFCFGRDGALTALDDAKRWIGKCSLPRRAARAQLKTMEVTGPVGCYLAPSHAAALRVALDRLEPEQAILAIIPDAQDAELMLHCEDFTVDFCAHRLHLIIGDDWPAKLRERFDQFPGLSLPTQFIRTPDRESAEIEALIARTQQIFSQVTAARATEIESLARRRRTHAESFEQSPRVCVVAPSRRILWNDWGFILPKSLGEMDVKRVDPSDPAQVAPLAVARAATDCDAIVTVNVSRAEAKNVVPTDLPWITWLCGGRVPPRDACGLRDRLILLDPLDANLARAAGWNEAEYVVAQPALGETLAIAPTTSREKYIAIISDTTNTEPPVSLDAYSSHRPLWQMIRNELLGNPFALQGDPVAYLFSRAQRLRVDEATIAAATFVSRLIIPAYQQGLALTMISQKVPLKVFGAGWRDCDARFAPSVACQSTDRDTLAAALPDAVAILHVWPNPDRVHAIDFAARPALRPGPSQTVLTRRCRDALIDKLARTSAISGTTSRYLDANLVRELLAAA